MSTWCCRTGNIKLFFKNYILYFSKYRHPRKGMFWLFCLIIRLYIYIVEKVAPLPHLNFILFCSLMCFLQIKTFMNIFCMVNDIPMGKCAHFPIHFYINWPNQDVQSSIFWKLSVEKSSPTTLCFYDWFFLTLVISCRITQINRHGYKLICLEWASLRLNSVFEKLFAVFSLSSFSVS